MADRAFDIDGEGMGGTMLKTWTDTHYKLEDEDWLYVAKDDRGGASLVCPGYARDGQGFSIHFTPTHLEILEHLVAALRSSREVANGEVANNFSDRARPKEESPKPVEIYVWEKAGENGQQNPNRDKDYKYPEPTPKTNRHLVR